MPLVRSTDPLRKIPFTQPLQAEAGVGLKEAYETTMRLLELSKVALEKSGDCHVKRVRAPSTAKNLVPLFSFVFI